MSPKTYTSSIVCFSEGKKSPKASHLIPKTVENRNMESDFSLATLVMTCEHVSFAQLGFSENLLF